MTCIPHQTERERWVSSSNDNNYFLSSKFNSRKFQPTAIMFHKTWRGRRNRKPLNTIFQICKRITLSTLFPTSILMQSWLVEYRSISLDHISDRFVNVSRLVTSYTVTIPTKKGKVLATNNLHIRNFRKELVTCVKERRTLNCYVPQIAFLVAKIAFLDVTNNN